MEKDEIEPPREFLPREFKPLPQVTAPELNTGPLVP